MPSVEADLLGGDEQRTRRENLKTLVETFHRGRHGDYDDTYEEFADQYGIEDKDDPEQICDDCGEERRALIHTDNELHPDDAVDGLVLHDFKRPDPLSIPRYASVAEDETYGMIHLFETLHEAVSDQASIPYKGETLNVPAGVYDLNDGSKIPVRMVALTEAGFRAACEAISFAISYDPAWNTSPVEAAELQAVFKQ